MAEMLRLFVAVELPAPLLDALSDLQRQLAGVVPRDSVRWTRPTGIHLTLKFLGDAPADQRRDIERGMAQAAAGRAPFALRVAGLGCFPNYRQPRVFWVGLEGDLTALHALRDAVEAAIAPLGYPTERRPFNPHLTLGRTSKHARKDEVAALGRALEGMDVGALGEIDVRGVSLMRSQLRPDGAVYTQLAYCKLEVGNA